MKKIIPVAEEVEYEEEAKKPDKARKQWKGRKTFIMACISSVVGLGNFWRFPYLTYKHGGVLFFVPYLIGLFIIGIPMLLLELTLGQKFQRGSIGVFRGIHPRIAGIGLTSILYSGVIVLYYSIILSWALYYLYQSFQSPLKWSQEEAKNY